jgi:hypothetical protein
MTPQPLPFIIIIIIIIITIIVIITIIIINGSAALVAFQFRDSVHSRQASLDGGSACRTYTEDNTNRI